MQLQRLNQLEQDFVGLHSVLTEVMTYHQTMGEKLSNEMTVMVQRLEGRIDRTEETQDGMIKTMREDHKKFMEEMRVTFL